MKEGTRVIHVSDPHGRNEGVITEDPSIRRGSYGLCKVRWISGVTETLHVSELREKSLENSDLTNGATPALI